MTECVKCGHLNQEGIENCERCSWPFNHAGWKKSSFKIQRVTIDTNCINVKRLVTDINTLEKWAKDGRITIQRSDIFLDELRKADLRNPDAVARIEKAKLIPTQPSPWILGVSGHSELGANTYLGGPDMETTINGILFPKSKNLTRSQTNDIQHLRLHIQTGGDIFVTRNPKDFIEHGKQQALMNKGIWVFSPRELVVLLEELYGWK
jgi:hypothetical protein